MKKVRPATDELAKRGRRAEPPQPRTDAPREVIPVVFVGGIKTPVQVCPKTGAYILFDRITHYDYY